MQPLTILTYLRVHISTRECTSRILNFVFHVFTCTYLNLGLHFLYFTYLPTDINLRLDFSRDLENYVSRKCQSRGTTVPVKTSMWEKTRMQDHNQRKGFISSKIYKSIFPNCTCPLVKQFKKVCKSTAVQCYKCFSLLSMLLLVFIASIAGKS